MEYAYNKKPMGRIARARISGVNASYKDLCEVCTNVRGKDTEYALNFLVDAAEMKKAILFLRHNHGKGHRRELGGKKGGFPIKSVKIVLGVVESAFANANKLGLGQTKIAHIMANKQHTYPRMSPKGRRIVHNYETAFVEVVLEEVQEKIGTAKKDSKKAMKKEAKAEVKKEAKKEDAKNEEKKSEEKKNEAKNIAIQSNAGKVSQNFSAGESKQHQHNQI